MNPVPARNDLGGKRILVTGAGSGIGLRFVREAVAEGASVVAMVRDDREAKAISDRVSPELLPADRILALDLASREEIAPMVAQAVAGLGGLDCLVHAAGAFDHRGALETDLSQWQAIIDVNLTASFLVAKACAEAMAVTGAGAIVLVSSQIGLVGHPRAAAYAASKSGVNGLTRALALELAPRGIRVNAVAPGPIATPMTPIARGDAARAEAIVSRIPLGRFGDAHEIAAAIRFLASDASSFVTGQILCVDGGYTAA